MPKRMQKRLSQFGVKGIKGHPDELGAERVLDRQKPASERRMTVFNKIEERERKKYENERFLEKIAKDMRSEEGISYEGRRDILWVLKDKGMSPFSKVAKIREILWREGF